MTQIRTLKKLIVSSIFILSAACTQVDVSGLNPDDFTNSGNGGGSTTDALCTGVSSNFSTDVIPIFNAKCAGTSCHTKGAAGGGLNLDTADNLLGDGFSGVIGNIKTKKELSLTVPAQSNLLLNPLATAEGGKGGSHTGGEIFPNTSDPDYKKIFCWINGGAKNDLTPSTCTFGENIYPIFSVRGCIGCHNNGTHAGNMSMNLASEQLLNDVPNTTYSFKDASTLDTYPDDVAEGNNDNSLILIKPIGGLSHGGGNVLGSATDPDYLKIKCWIDEGAKDN